MRVSLAHQHELNVYSTVFYLRPPAGRNDPGIYSYGDDTIGGLRFTYNVIRVYELDGAAHLNPEAPGVAAVHAVDEASVGYDK